VVDHDLAQAVVDLGDLSLAFGRIERITRHPDGRTPESDTDHTVMLGLIACALVPAVRADLDVGLVAQYALVHDVVEVYAGDTATLRVLSDAARADKATRERQALERITAQFAHILPWLPERIAEYEARSRPEARYVKALDKLLPKITHLLNGLATIRAQRMSINDLAIRYDVQAEEIAAYAADFPVLLQLRAALVDLVLRRAESGGPDPADVGTGPGPGATTSIRSRSR
jgi:5'-deoxynucleotidase YfbR-like HD superfamily hydrolase